MTIQHELARLAEDFAWAFWRLRHFILWCVVMVITCYSAGLLIEHVKGLFA